MPRRPEHRRRARAFQAVDRVDVVIVARGGGSTDDLAAFNDERVVRAVFACRGPGRRPASATRRIGRCRGRRRRPRPDAVRRRRDLRPLGRASGRATAEPGIPAGLGARHAKGRSRSPASRALVQRLAAHDPSVDDPRAPAVRRGRWRPASPSPTTPARQRRRREAASARRPARRPQPRGRARARLRAPCSGATRVNRSTASPRSNRAIPCSRSWPTARCQAPWTARPCAIPSPRPTRNGDGGARRAAFHLGRAGHDRRGRVRRRAAGAGSRRRPSRTRPPFDRRVRHVV